MATKPYLRKHENGVWYVWWYDGRPRRISTRTRDESEAEDFLAEYLRRIGAEPWQAAVPAKMQRALFEEPAPLPKDAKLEEVWRIYYAQHIEVRAAAAYSAKMTWNQLRPFFGKLPVGALTQNAVDAYVALRTCGRLGRKVKPQTAARELVSLVAAIRFCAKRKGIIPTSCIRELQLPGQGEPRDKWLRDHEIEALHAAAATFRRGGRLDRGERFLWLALETAGRKQALLDLTWDRVDFETNVIYLDVPGRLKTKKRRATVPISENLRPILQRAYDERINDRVLDNEGAVWPIIQSIVVRAGLAPKTPRATGKKPKGTGISPNVFRHTAATMMARRGVPLWKIAKILGNSMDMVEKVYAKHCPDDLREAVNLITGKRKPPAPPADSDDAAA